MAVELIGAALGLVIVFVIVYWFYWDKRSDNVIRDKGAVYGFFDDAEERIETENVNDDYKKVYEKELKPEISEIKKEFDKKTWKTKPKKVKKLEEKVLIDIAPKLPPNPVGEILVFSIFSVSDEKRKEVIGYVEGEIEMLNRHFSLPLEVIDGNKKHSNIAKMLEETVASVVEKMGMGKYKMDLLRAYDTIEEEFHEKKHKYNIILLTGDTFKGNALHYYPFEIETGGRATGNIGPIVFLRILEAPDTIQPEVWHETGHLLGVPSPKRDYKKYWNNCPKESCLMHHEITGDWFCDDCLKDIKEAWP
jgi:hypothetical protein